MTTGELIRLLSDGDYHSGEQLGERFGVSRTAVWKQLKKLESQGIVLEAVRGRGYRLASPLELLDGPLIVGSLRRDSRRHLARLFVEESLDSTNLFLRERFSQGAGHAEVCLAESQSAGRGRRGRQWLSGWGQGLTLSLGWRFEGGAAALEGLSLAIGVVMAQVLERHGLEIRLKWPNDVLMLTAEGEKRKLAGILLELTGDAEGPCEVVAGIGLNIVLPASLNGHLDQPAAAVTDQAPGVSRNGLAAELIGGVLELMADFEQTGFVVWQEAWNRRNAYSGQEVDVIQSTRRYTATDGGVDESGNLLVRQGSEELRLVGGEISLRGRP
ncbi:BirA family transcriptional regulator, biotin operon repressor / biotin-[acetyl-CoA-carboxylase] ligase [Modicisalibacter ilicicola DSM 19980]|uniref:Bifunctional ligase/repressor BirA n=1 Tax=Modicisalibacter ilicicola DSM 19980 TaxID=1121942 RepID=A0A1M5CSM0_9GAMM|nr:biotin--[acetyl-CoA-carboxylase] ligase [Halomonas ilicicola]SHF57731.1 BirA family transcriptional regulator, biotin operon repressor / biotin-[acetyl-CoA-carboxylase] ligase [Halomonas ilicicola DSM 19980]